MKAKHSCLPQLKISDKMSNPSTPGQGIPIILADIKTTPELNTNILHFSVFVFKECFTAVVKFYVS